MNHIALRIIVDVLCFVGLIAGYLAWKELKKVFETELWPMYLVVVMIVFCIVNALVVWII